MKADQSIQLAEENILDALRGPVQRQPRMTTNASRPSLDRHRFQVAVRPCSCGKCARCVENARWDRIFNEKFADPDYYSQPILARRHSPWD